MFQVEICSQQLEILIFHTVYKKLPYIYYEIEWMEVFSERQFCRN